AGGASQEIVLRNGVEIADYNGRHDVDGSKGLNWTTGRGQIRWFSKDVKNRAVIERLVLESYDNAVSPTFFAITAEIGAPAGASAAPAGGAPGTAPTSAAAWGEGIHVLLIGGGASHDYQRWFNLADVALLNGTGRMSARYVEPPAATVELVRGADVLVISANQAFPKAEVREAIFAHAAAGRGLVLLHPGLWYNWPDWAVYNRELAGGGSRGHDRYGEFEVTVTRPDHPLLQGVPARFKLSDELYWFEPDTGGTPVQVLATAQSGAKGKAFPQVFVVEHPRTRIAGITLGHDGVAHSHPAYQQLLRNAVYWTARQERLMTAR
ncbi:MAG: ThuA domain-containing protein, partial [Verrucomicrobiota bacterium]